MILGWFYFFVVACKLFLGSSFAFGEFKGKWRCSVPERLSARTGVLGGFLQGNLGFFYS